MRSPRSSTAENTPRPGRPPRPDQSPGPGHPNHLAARVARWSVRHRRLALGGWVLAIVLTMVIGSMIGTKSLKDEDFGTGESGRADHTLTEHGFVDTATENVLIQRATAAHSPQELLADPAVAGAVTDVAARVGATGVATAMRSPVAAAGAITDPGLVSRDLRSVLVTFDLKGTSDDHASVDPTLDAVAAAKGAHPGVSIEQFGDASSDKALNATVGKDFKRAELLAIPLTLGILLAVFGALVAAVIPVGLALTAFIGTLGLVAFASRLMPTNETATSVMLLIGLAVGVDYALFYIRREREERAAGRGPERALEIAAETSGHSILVSGLTVAASMGGLVITGMSVFTGIAVGTIIVVLVAVVGSLTALPALLSMLGDRVELLRLPWRKRRSYAPAKRHGRGRRTRAHRGTGTDRTGGALVDVLGASAHGMAGTDTDAGTDTGTDADADAERIERDHRLREYQEYLAKPGIMGRLLRRPGPVAAIAGGALVLLALPALGMHTIEPGVNDIPQNLPIMKTYQRLEAAFPGGQVAASVVVSAPDVTTPDVTAGITALRTRAVASGEMFEPVQIAISRDHQVAKVTIPIAGDGTDSVSTDALRTLRGTVIPATIGLTPRAHADVTGDTAGSVDFNKQLNGRTPLVIGFVMALTFVLLLLAFRSAAIAGIAVGLNLLSVGAAYGLLALVFQHSWANGLLDYTSTGAITNWLPLMLFVILFGLSMDYQVFVLSRVREAREAGLSMRDAVTVGVRRSAGVVTSAAVIMVAVFAIFATLSQVSMKQLGVGLGAAILIDATLIRVVLMPAVLTLLGDRAWRGGSAGTPAGGLPVQAAGPIPRPARPASLARPERSAWTVR